MRWQRNKPRKLAQRFWLAPPATGPCPPVQRNVAPDPARPVMPGALPWHKLYANVGSQQPLPLGGLCRGQLWRQSRPGHGVLVRASSAMAADPEGQG